MGSSMQKYVAPNYLAFRVCVERTLDNPARASISRKSFSLVRFKASLWVRFLFGWVVGNPETTGSAIGKVFGKSGIWNSSQHDRERLTDSQYSRIEIAMRRR
jgi:hypothetical protein